MNFLFQPSPPGIFLWCILMAAVLIYMPFLVVAYNRLKIGYDIAAPRTMFDKLPAYAQRATWAHQNSFESFGLFAAGALMAYVTHLDSSVAVGAAIAHVITRFFYSLFYILNLPLLRSSMFAVGSLGTFTLMVLSLLNVGS